MDYIPYISVSHRYDIIRLPRKLHRTQPELYTTTSTSSLRSVLSLSISFQLFITTIIIMPNSENDITKDPAASAASSSTADPTASSSSKRQKRDILQVDITTTTTTTSSNNENYYHADPFPHVIIPNVFTEEFLSTVIRDIKDHSTVDFKESDLFKVFQSMDLSSPSTELPPAVQQLRDILYSAPWRQWIAQQCRLDGTPTTTTTTDTTTTTRNSTSSCCCCCLAATPLDCAVNAHARGCHLLCHDDAMSTRRVSFVLYLTDARWNVDTDGGGLELYSTFSDHHDGAKSTTTVCPIPCRTLTPTRNQLVVFPVEPGVSLHAVQEVRRESAPRLALQGWYHSPPATHHDDDDATPEATSKEGTTTTTTTTKQVDAGTRKGTLQELKEPPPSESSGLEQYTPLDGLDVETSPSAADDTAATKNNNNDISQRFALTDADRTLLQKWINPTYLTEESMQELRERFDADSAIQLHAFLTPETTFVVPSEDDDTNPSDYTYGVSDTWTTVGPPHKQRYLEYNDDDDADASNPPTHNTLATIRNELLTTPAFAKYLHALTALTVRGWHNAHIRRFRRGRDYTVAHHGQLLDYSILDATLCFVADDDTNDTSAAWAGGDVGGYDCYTAAADDDDANAGPDDTYMQQNDDDNNDDEDDKDELLNVPAAHNTLSLVYRDPGTMRFIKYVSAAAPSARWDIAMEYSVPPDEDDDDDDGGDKDEEDEEEDGNEVTEVNDEDEGGMEEGATEADEGEPQEEVDIMDAAVVDQADGDDESPVVSENAAD